MTGGNYKWGLAKGKGKRRNSLRLHFERQVMGFSNDHKEGEGRKAKLRRKWGRENIKLLSWNVQRMKMQHIKNLYMANLTATKTS
jgi:hypothetical protein